MSAYYAHISASRPHAASFSSSGQLIPGIVHPPSIYNLRIPSIYNPRTYDQRYRFEQVKPKVIFAVDAVVYNAKVHPHLPKLSSLLSGLQSSSASPSASSSSTSIPIRPTVILISPLPSSLTSGLPPLESLGYDDVVRFEEFRGRGKGAGEKGLGRRVDVDGKGEGEVEIEWRRMGFDWPLWVLFSSGTTGTSSRPLPLSLPVPPPLHRVCG